MSARATLTIFTAVAAVALACGQSPRADLSPIPPPDYRDPKEVVCPGGPPITSAVTPSDDAGMADVYAAEYPVVSEEYVKDVAARMGVSGVPRYNAEAGTYLVGDQLVVQQDGSFGIFFDTARGSVTQLSDESALKIAEDYVRRHGLLGTENLRLEVDYRSSQQISVFVMPENINNPYYGARMLIGASGSPDWISYNWPDIHSIGKYPIVSEAEALQRLERCEVYKGGRVRFAFSVQRIELTYIGVPQINQFKYLAPVYRFVLVDEGHGIETSQIVPALPDEYISE